MSEFTVYAIRLTPSVWDSPKFQKRNKSADPSRDAFYVGSTGKDVKDRMVAHLAGNPGKGGTKIVRDYHESGPVVIAECGSRQEAEAAEKAYAEAMQSAGHGIWSNRKARR